MGLYKQLEVTWKVMRTEDQLSGPSDLRGASAHLDLIPFDRGGDDTGREFAARLKKDWKGRMSREEFFSIVLAYLQAVGVHSEQRQLLLHTLNQKGFEAGMDLIFDEIREIEAQDF